MILGLYVPGNSVLHRCPAVVKLALLVLAGVGSVFVRSPEQALGYLAAVLLLHPVGGFGVPTVWRQLRPLFWLVLILGGFHILISGWERAVVVLGVLIGLVLLAGLVTLTTKTSDLIDVVVQVLGPLRRFGVDPDRIGLLMSLAIRSVPVVTGLAREVREAQLARGLGTSPRAFATPLLIRSLRHANTLGDALVARGVDD